MDSGDNPPVGGGNIAGGEDPRQLPTGIDVMAMLGGDPEAPPVDAAPAVGGAGADQQVAAKLLAWEGIGLPIILSLMRGGEMTDAEREQRFRQILTYGLDWAAETADWVGAGAGGDQDWVRWRLSAGMIECVSAHVAEFGEVPGDDLRRMFRRWLDDMQAAAATAGLVVESVQNRLELVEALEGVAAAISRYSFNDDPASQARDVVRRLQDLGAGLRQALDGAGGPPSSPVRVLKVLARAYAAAHHDEIDRLLEMSAEIRAAYVARHDGKVPLDPIWEKVDRYADVLRAMAEALRLPGGSAVEAAP